MVAVTFHGALPGQRLRYSHVAGFSSYPTVAVGYQLALLMPQLISLSSCTLLSSLSAGAVTCLSAGA